MLSLWKQRVVAWNGEPWPESKVWPHTNTFPLPLSLSRGFKDSDNAFFGQISPYFSLFWGKTDVGLIGFSTQKWKTLLSQTVIRKRCKDHSIYVNMGVHQWSWYGHLHMWTIDMVFYIGRDMLPWKSGKVPGYFSRTQTVSCCGAKCVVHNEEDNQTVELLNCTVVNTWNWVCNYV